MTGATGTVDGTDGKEARISVSVLLSSCLRRVRIWLVMALSKVVSFPSSLSVRRVTRDETLIYRSRGVST